MYINYDNITFFIWFAIAPIILINFNISLLMAHPLLTCVSGLTDLQCGNPAKTITLLDHIPLSFYFYNIRLFEYIDWTQVLSNNK